jgi:NAD(P)-dependent dehydrogenase (short-subunit alcohol dehydrogenase family)
MKLPVLMVDAAPQLPLGHHPVRSNLNESNMNLAITGATSGIGIETVKALAPNCKQIYLLVRNIERADELINQWTGRGYSSKFHVIPCDLSDLGTVMAATEKMKALCPQLDVLINNAGGIFKERQLTKDGIESSFSINHLGHFLLTRRLMPLLLAAGTARVINVSSDAHKIAKPDMSDLQSSKAYHALKVYANVKLFNILFTRSLAERYGNKGIYAFALHPGMVRTNFGSGYTGLIKLGMKIVKPLMISPEKGASTSVFLAQDASVLQYNGGYFKKKTLSKTSKMATSADLRNQVWEESEKQLRSRGIEWQVSQNGE